MKDRSPQYPGRVTLTPVSGATNTYDMSLADEPVEEGTPLNKATLLADTTAALMGLGTAATPDDMFKALANKANGLIIAGTTELTPGVSPLASGTLYVVHK